MRCDQSLESLVASLHHELTLEDEQALHAHLAVCHTCQHEMDVNRSIKRFLRHAVPVEPTAEFRQNLGQRIEQAVEGSPASSKSRLIAEPGKPKSARVIPPPKETRQSSRLPDWLLDEKPARLGAPPEKPAAPKSKPAIPVEQVAQSHLPVRIYPAEAPAAPTSSHKTLLVVCVLVSVSATIFAFFPMFAQTGNQANRTQAERTTSDRRWEERHVASMRNAMVRGFIFKDEVPVGDGIAEGETVHIARHHDERTGESCLVIFKDSDVRALAADPRVDQTAFAAILKQSAEIQVANGKVVFPVEWIQLCIGLNDVPAIIKVMRLNNRTEVWSSAALDDYLKDSPKYQTVKNTDAVVLGLPSER